MSSLLFTVAPMMISGTNSLFETSYASEDEDICTTTAGYTSVVEDLTKLGLYNNSYKVNQVIDFQEYYDQENDKLEYFVYVYYDSSLDDSLEEFKNNCSYQSRHVVYTISFDINLNNESYTCLRLSNNSKFYKLKLNVNEPLVDDDSNNRSYLISDCCVTTDARCLVSPFWINLKHSYNFSQQSTHFTRKFDSIGSYGSQNITITEDKVVTIQDKRIVVATVGVERDAALWGLLRYTNEMASRNRYYDNWFVCFNTDLDDDIANLKQVTLNYQEYKYVLEYERRGADAFVLPNQSVVYPDGMDVCLTSAQVEEIFDNDNYTSFTGKDSSGKDWMVDYPYTAKMRAKNNNFKFSLEKIKHPYITIYEGKHAVVTTKTYWNTAWTGDVKEYVTYVDNILDLSKVTKTLIPDSNPNTNVCFDAEALSGYRWAINYASTEKYFEDSKTTMRTFHASSCNSGVEILQFVYEDVHSGKVLTARAVDEPTQLDEPITIKPPVLVEKNKSFWDQIVDFFSSIFNWFKQAWAWIVGIGLAIVGLILLSLVIKFISPVFKSLSTANEIKKAKKAEKKKQMISNPDDKQIIININGDEKFHPRRKKK